MTRAVRLLALSASLLSATAYAGCGSSTTLEDFDTGGGSGTDSGVRPVDTGMIQMGDASPIGNDTGTILPFDAGSMPADDAGPFVRPDSGFTRPDTGPPMPGNDAGTTTGVMCGTETCTASQECCVTRGSAGMMISQTCTDPGMCTGAALACDGPEDCAAGEACCGTFIGTTAGSMCVADSMCTRGRFCHATTDCTGADMCCSFMGVSVCSPRCF